MYFLLFPLVILAAVYLLHRHIAGANLSKWDTPVEENFRDEPASEIHQQSVAKLKVRDPHAAGLSPKQMLDYMRKLYDDSGTLFPISSEIIDVVDAPVKGEWIVAAGSDSTKRMLYVHGGAFKLGSPRSHRCIADAMSKALGGPVFVPDYRLTPENHRNDCVTDTRASYEWIWNNAPNEISVATHVFVAGDSAGGNLALGLLPWIRDNRKPPVTACIGLSPGLDLTASAKSYKANLDKDTLLRPILEVIRNIPNWVLPWAGLFDGKVRPAAPHISPLFDQLHQLPPTLLQASTAECLEDDSRRWANKARAAGSPVTLQLWSNMLHVWQTLICVNAPEAIEAFEQIEQFIQAQLNSANAKNNNS
jgi:monoterpene epsilon-lactone hydrolase